MAMVEEPAEGSQLPPQPVEQVEATQEYPSAKTSDFYSVKNVPERFNHPDWFEGYDTRSQHPFFSTSSSKHGSKAPSVHTMPTQFHGRSQKFTKNMGKFGMYRNHSLNTAMDRSKV